MWEEDNIKSSQFQAQDSTYVGQHHYENQLENQCDWVPSFQTSFILKTVALPHMYYIE